MTRINSWDDESIKKIAAAVRLVQGQDQRTRPQRRRKNTPVPSAGIRIAVLNGDLAHGGSASASIYIANEGSESDSTIDVTVYDWEHIGSGKEIVTGTKIFIAPVDGYWYVLNTAACSTTV